MNVKVAKAIRHLLNYHPDQTPREYRAIQRKNGKKTIIADESRFKYQFAKKAYLRGDAI